MRPTLVLLIAAVAGPVLALSGGAALAQRRSGDLIETAPDFEARGVRSIALMPAVSYHNDLKSEQAVEQAVAQALRGFDYKWRSPVTVGVLLRAAKAESLWQAQREAILEEPRLDSLAAPRLCAALRTDAVLTIRIDLFERRSLEWNEAGKPSTTIQLKAALVDSSGALLWYASGSETLEGPYHDPGEGAVGVPGSGLATQPNIGTRSSIGKGEAPSYEAVLARLLERWSAQFPAPPGADPDK